MGKYFGTDGIRGVANASLSPEFVFKLGRASSFVLSKYKKHSNPLFVIVGMDTRISGHLLEASLVSGMCSSGANVALVGVVPTPAVSFFIKHFNADAGVVISASHNPFYDNGIKFFDCNGFKLNDCVEAEIENIIDFSMDTIPYPTHQNIGFKKLLYDASNEYIDFLASTLNSDLSGLNVLVDCANGATSNIAPLLFKRLNANATFIFNNPNGTNINFECGSTHMQTLSEKVKEGKFDLGIAFDGDGDRCLAIDENGQTVDGDHIMAICSNFLKQNNKLNNNTFVATVMSNLGLFIMADKNDTNVIKANVGDRYVLEELLKNNLNFGGEQSGHIIFLDYNTTGDGLLTAIQLIHIIKKSNQKLSQLKSILNILPQVLLNAKVSNEKKYNFMQDPTIKEAIAKIEQKFEGQGRVLIRASGTEPLVRVMIEGNDKDILLYEAKKLVELIEKVLN